MPLFETVTDLENGAEALRRRPYGVIEFVDGRFRRVRLRPFPRLVTGPEVLLVGGAIHRHRSGDRLWLYYNQPRRCPDFLVLKYVVSTRQASLASLRRTLDVLDEIARLKRSDALLCDAGNWRISNRLMTRWGWVPHCPSRWHRHYIKRLYGEHPHRPAWLEASFADAPPPCTRGELVDDAQGGQDRADAAVTAAVGVGGRTASV